MSALPRGADLHAHWRHVSEVPKNKHVGANDEPEAALWREAIHLVNDGVASVADVDAGIAYGPGLRWAIMGPHLLFHLAGGVGGMTHFMPHLGVPIARDWWPALGNPDLTPELQKQIIDGVAEEAAGRTIPELAAERDRCLIAILEALKTVRGEGRK